MLIQITNRCRMDCPHCMDASTPDGGLMLERTFRRAVRFALDNGCAQVVVSGGEPTEHPDFAAFCKIASQSGLPFTVCTNGMWLGDEKREWMFEKVAKLRGFLGAQVYTNPKWYQLHDETVAKYSAQAGRWRSLGILLDTSDIICMSDVGRAKGCDAAVREARASKYHNMCLSAHLAAVQSDSLRQFFFLMSAQGRFCTPLVDWRGCVRMGESCLCQTVADLEAAADDAVFAKMKASRPCGGCIPCQRYLTEQTPKMCAVRRILGQESAS